MRMTSAHRFSIAALVASLVALAIVIPTASARRTAPEPTAQAQSPRGQTVTRLADGRSLILGGESPDGTVATATLLDPATNARTTIPALSRAGHTATLLPDGTVLIAGGVGPAGQPVPVAELFDPAANVFVPVGASAGMQRAGHTATVLTDGSVFVAGGTGVDGEPRTDAEIWRVEGATLSVTAVAAPVRQPGRVLAATLLPDGTVLLGHDNGA